MFSSGYTSFLKWHDGLLGCACFGVLLSWPILAQATPTDASARSEMVDTELFLGGTFMELGISRYGDFGSYNSKPEGFWGTTNRSNIGMSVDLDGFGSGQNLTMDYFLPGTPEERFHIGIDIAGTLTSLSNMSAGNTYDMPTTVTDISNISAGELGALVVSTHDKVSVQQRIEFNAADKFFRNEVTLTNTSGSIIDRLRYVRSFDPDNTVDQGGDYSTSNQVEYHHSDYDGKEVVRAKTHSDSDPIFEAMGSRAPIFLYSKDPKVRVSFANPGSLRIRPFDDSIWDIPADKGSVFKADTAISIAYQIEDLADGESVSFIYYTSMDDRVFQLVEQDIIADDAERRGILANPDLVLTAINTAVTYDVAANDVDAEGDDLFVSSADLNIGEGSISISGGSISFTPTDGYEGIAVVNYQVTDGVGHSNISNFRIAVGDANLAPQALEDSAITYVDSAVTVDVLANDSDANGDALTVSVDSVSNGTAVVIDNAVVYTPTADYSGYASVVYTIDDGNGGTSSSVITVEVADNFAPVAVDDATTMYSNTSLTISVLSNDSDADDNLDATSVATVTAPRNGSAVVNSSTGQIVYTPTADYIGNDSFTYTVNDDDGLQSNVATVTLSVVEGSNAAPVFIGLLSASVAENQTLAITLTGSDENVADTLLFSLTGGDDVDTFTLDASTGIVSFNTAPDFETPTDADGDNVYQFTATVTDDGSPALNVSQTITVTVTNVNEAPVISHPAAPVLLEDGEHTFTADEFGFSDIDSELASITITELSAAGQLLYQNSDGNWVAVIQGQVVSQADLEAGKLKFVPAADANGADYAEFSYSVSDGEVSSATVIMPVAVTPVADAPIFTSADAVTLAENQTLVQTVTATDADGDSLSYQLDGGVDVALFSLDATRGELTFVAAPDFDQPSDSNGDNQYQLNVMVSDGDGGHQVTQAITVTITDINEAPVFTSASVLSADENQTTVVTLSGLDQESDSLSFSLVGGDDIAAFELDAETGVLRLVEAANFEIASDADSNGVYQLIVAVSDSVNSVEQVLTVTVNDVNEAPWVEPVAQIVLLEDSERTLLVSDFNFKDVDVDDALESLSITELPLAGQLLLQDGNGDWQAVIAAQVINLAELDAGLLKFVPALNANGDHYGDFGFSLNDGELDSELATMVVNVGAINDAPVISHPAAPVLLEDGEHTFTADEFGFSDIDSELASITITELSAAGQLLYQNSDGNWVAVIQGQVVSQADLEAGKLKFVPAADANGADYAEFSYSVSDGEVSSAAVTMPIAVTSVNDAPLAVDDQLSAAYTSAGLYTLDILANDSDPEGQLLTLLSASSSYGEVTIVSGLLQLEVPLGTFGELLLSYVVADSDDAYDQADVVFTITAAVDPELPVIIVPEDKAVNATGLYTKVDLGTPSAKDQYGRDIPVSLVDGTTLFKPGSHQVYWEAVDADGNRAINSQGVTVRPLISIAKDAHSVEGNVVNIKVILNGESPVLPLVVPYHVSGSAGSNDHDLLSGELVIESGTVGIISISLYEDGIVEGDEQIIITLDESLNVGSNYQHILTIVEGNVAPKVAFSVSQDDQLRRVLTQTDDLVTVQALVTDANLTDNHSYLWSSETLASLADTDSDHFEFNPATLSLGVHQLTLRVTDDGIEPESTEVSLFVEITASLPVLGDQDSDGDLIPDSQEGLGDSDNDGILDYLDAIAECNVMPGQLASADAYMIEGEPGVCLSKGLSVNESRSGGLQLMDGDIESDVDYRNVGGLFDFVARGLPLEGQSYSLVIPQRLPIPAGATYRKLVADEWVSFIEDDNNSLMSTAGEVGYCPPPGGDVWTADLTEGDWCVQVTIEDGGPNDDDGLANRTIVDPGGVAVLINTNVAPESSDQTVTLYWNDSVTIDVLSGASDADGDALQLSYASASEGTVEVIDGQLQFQAPINQIGSYLIVYGISDGQGGSVIGRVTVNVVEPIELHAESSGGSLGLWMLALLSLLAVRRFDRYGYTL
ncbi:protein of unknown function [Shewanella benthica]|uniref:Cadherin domain-containing protein n=1 Tax=Shewanella benthica TaxID=43661 RepID=A0A330MA82_9GAMM|nr:tandem-95 repeat protein [Shewanella benthica]SQH78373.1 protein of unknown function [Shewanella benthica]